LHTAFVFLVKNAVWCGGVGTHTACVVFYPRPGTLLSGRNPGPAGAGSGLYFVEPVKWGVKMEGEIAAYLRAEKIF
jgi:hypothetical protein